MGWGSRGVVGVVMAPGVVGGGWVVRVGSLGMLMTTVLTVDISDTVL